MLIVSEESEPKYGAAHTSSEQMTIELISPTLGGATNAPFPSGVK